jgi:hypothetical protein
MDAGTKPAREHHPSVQLQLPIPNNPFEVIPSQSKANNLLEVIPSQRKGAGLGDDKAAELYFNSVALLLNAEVQTSVLLRTSVLTVLFLHMYETNNHLL